MSTILSSALSQGLAIAALGFAFALVYWSTRVFFVALGTLFVLAPLLVVDLQREFGLGDGVVLAVVAVTMLSLLLGWANYGRLLRKGSPSGVHFACSLALYFLIAESAALRWGADVQSLAVLPGISELIRGKTFLLPTSQFIAIGACAALIAAMFLGLRFSGHWVKLRALADNPAELSRSGYNPVLLRATAFAVSGLAAGSASIAIAVGLAVGAYSGMGALIPAATVTLLTPCGPLAEPPGLGAVPGAAADLGDVNNFRRLARPGDAGLAAPLAPRTPSRGLARVEPWARAARCPMSYGLHLLNLVLVYGLSALGLSLCVGHVGQLSMAQAASFGVGTYAYAIFGVAYLPPSWAALDAATGVAVVFALLQGFIARSLAENEFVFGTLAFNVVIAGLFNGTDGTSRLGSLRNLTNGPYGITDVPPLPSRALGAEPWLLTLSIAVVVSILLVASYAAIASPWGRLLRAIRDSPTLALSLGRRVFSERARAAEAASFLGSMAGAHYAAHARHVDLGVAATDPSVFFLTCLLLGDRILLGVGAPRRRLCPWLASSPRVA